jgi:hypothetical protein
VFMLASSHALTSRITPESGLAGRSGGRTGGRGETRSMFIGSGGTGGALSRLDAAPVEGAVRGRLRDIFRCISVGLSSVFSICRDATLRKCRCSHFFADPCLLVAVVIVCSVAVAVMLCEIEGAVCESVVR